MVHITTPQKISLELAEETGWHIGDGTMNFYINKGKLNGSYSLRGHIIDDVPHYNNIIKQTYKTLYGFEPPIRSMKSTGVYGFQVWSKDIVNFKHKILNLPLGKKLNIKLPKILIKSKAHQIALIRGIYDTDGTLYLEPRTHRLYPRIHIPTISQILAKQLQKILLNLNFRTTVYTEPRKHKGWNDLHIVSIRGDKMLNKWFKIIKPANPKHTNKYNFYINNT